jgi:acetolactate synthase I/II/III large subunit
MRWRRGSGGVPLKTGPSRRVSRRGFLERTVFAGAALGLGGPAETLAQDKAVDGVAHSQPSHPKAPASAVPAPDLAAEREVPPAVPPLTINRPGSDFMVDVLKTLDIDYVAANPGSTFRGLQESLINYGRNARPEFLTCCHEESSVAMAHGYFKIAGKPMAAMVHGTVGVQHASMAIYNAYADRIPVLIISGNALDANTRRVPVEWDHSVQDNAAIVRDYTKWDDTPVSLQHFAESMVRAVRLATALPSAPVMITVDMDLQENELPRAEESLLRIPKLVYDTPPQGEEGALKEAAKWLVASERPVIIADRYARTEQAIPLLAELAELVQAPVIDTGNRVNFLSSHPLNQSARRAELIATADFILALEPVDLWGMTHRIRDVIGKPWTSIVGAQTKIVSLGTGELLIKANYQDFQRYSSADIAITGDPEATMPALIDAVRRAASTGRKRKFEERRQKLERDHQDMATRTREAAAVGWTLSPVHPARVAMEVWEQVKHKDWSVVGSQVSSPSAWAHRLWPMDKPYSHTGGDGASGVGYGLPSAVGSALANRDRGRLSINFQSDGDFMYAPGVLWTAAHHRIPLLTVMFNNRGYHQELMHLQVMANRHNRDIDRAGIGTSLLDPNLDFAKIARGMGVYAEGPITDPDDLREAIQRALAVVERGAPALIDVISQPR